jgi:Dyp-type peroxidase family
MAQPVTDYDDIQGILSSGFGRLEEACFLLLRVADQTEAKAWLAAVVEEHGDEKLPYRVTHAGHLESYQKQALQIAFTAQGLRKLGLADDLIGAFSREFRLGMAAGELDAEGRSRRLGDIGENAPSNWAWGTPVQTPDVMVMLYAETSGLAAFQQMVMEDLASGFEVILVLGTAKAAAKGKTRREPFGFIDGISQPEIDWDARREPGTSADLEYGNLITAGEFLLGYQNEYGLYTQRPLLDPTQDLENILAPAEDYPCKHDLGRNGTYLVFRQLEQDVSGFRRFVSAVSPTDDGIGLAEAMVGRRLATGDPLFAASQADIRGVTGYAGDIRRNGFTFDADPDGLGCPFGAHIRRANPRTSDLPGGRQGFLSWALRTLGLKHGGPREDLLSSSRFHRIVRRGRPYGAVTRWGSTLQNEAPGSTSGIYFISLNANIARQFEFIQNAWIVNPNFNGLDGESDPLLGTRVPTPGGRRTDGFSLPRPSGRNRRIAGLPQFVTVRGGAYFFLPSLRALRFFARLEVNG